MPNAQLVEEMVIQASIIAQIPVKQAIYSKAGINITFQGQSASYYQYEISPTTPGAPGKAQIVQPNAISTILVFRSLTPQKMIKKLTKQRRRQKVQCRQEIGHVKNAGRYNRARSYGEKSEQVRIKDTLFHESKPRAFSQRVRTRFRKMVGRISIPNKRNNDRAYTSGAPEDDDEDLAPSEDWRDEKVDTFIDQILMSMEQYQEEENND
ncbi:hypothetical protein K3495_g4402 [Podosphaera aphanis]|nr:hypothetical protein K3495_g4402 [Podosphaera aphanis]